MPLSEIQLVFLPPIGSDERAYHYQLSLPFHVITPKHIAWRDNETLHDHAVRYFVHLVSSGQVDLGKPIVWSGLSLGGALAQEFSAIHAPLAQILIGTFASSSELSPVIQRLGRMAERIPLLVYRIAGRIAPVVMKAIGYMDARDIDLMVDGYRRQSKRGFRNALKALSAWGGVGLSPNIPTLRIHGAKDPLIPISRVQHVDLVIDTLHLLTLAKPAEVNASVTAFVSRLALEG